MLNRHKTSSVPGSTGMYTTYLYPNRVDTKEGIMSDDFISTALDIFRKGDELKVFTYDEDDNIVEVYKFLILDVDQIARTSEKVLIEYINVAEKKLIEASSKKKLEKTEVK